MHFYGLPGPGIRPVRRSRRLWGHALGQQVQSRGGEGAHVAEAVPLTRFQRDNALDGPGDGQAGVPRRIPVSVACGPRRPCLGQGPGGAETRPPADDSATATVSCRSLRRRAKRSARGMRSFMGVPF